MNIDFPPLSIPGVLGKMLFLAIKWSHQLCGIQQSKLILNFTWQWQLRLFCWWGCALTSFCDGIASRNSLVRFLRLLCSMHFSRDISIDLDTSIDTRMITMVIICINDHIVDLPQSTDSTGRRTLVCWYTEFMPIAFYWKYNSCHYFRHENVYWG